MVGNGCFEVGNVCIKDWLEIAFIEVGNGCAVVGNGYSEAGNGSIETGNGSIEVGNGSVDENGFSAVYLLLRKYVYAFKKL